MSGECGAFNGDIGLFAGEGNEDIQFFSRHKSFL